MTEEAEQVTGEDILQVKAVQLPPDLNERILMFSKTERV